MAAYRRRGLVDEDRRARPPGDGLDPHGPAPGEEVDDRHGLEVDQAPEDVEDRLSDPIRRGAGGRARRSPEEPATEAAGDHTHGRSVRLGRGRPWAGPTDGRARLQTGHVGS